MCDLWREDLNAQSLQSKFCHVCIRKSIKYLCSPNGTVLKAVLSISHIFNAGFSISKHSNTNVSFLQISCQKIVNFT